MSKATLIAILIAVISAFSSLARAQTPLKPRPAAKSDQPTYVITAHAVVHDPDTNSQLDNYIIVYGSEVLKVQYAESQISTVKPGASLLDQIAPSNDLHLHARYSRWPQEPDTSQVPHIGVSIRACEMDTKYPDSSGHPVIAIQSVTAPCMSRDGDTLHYSIAPNGGVKMWEYVNFDILEETNTDVSAGLVTQHAAPESISNSAKVGVVPAQSAPPRKDIPAIAKAANGAIVSILMSDKDGKPVAQGTGFLISNDGAILTNYHVIAEGSSAVAKFPDGAFCVVDGVLASDKARDIAVIKIHGQNFRTLPLGDSDQLQVGEDVVAIGNPLSLESTVSNGIVSGIRTFKEEGGKFLQITAPISPGSSGGPLFNMAGEVVGITTLYLKAGENLNFAIPVNDAKRLLLGGSARISALPNEPVQSPVENATTADQCNADARIWMVQRAEDDNKLSYKEILARRQEMTDCRNNVKVKDESGFRAVMPYLTTASIYEMDAIFRMSRYIWRHDAQSQIISEDVPIWENIHSPPKRAPTQKQCQADVSLWVQQNEARGPDGFSAHELYARKNEMADCMSQARGSDPSTVATYVSVSLVYMAAAEERLRAYLLRHNESGQFMSEDAAGVR